MWPTLKSAVVSMCLPSGLQRTAQSPAEPSSILQVHSGCSMDQTCNMTKPFLTVIPFKKKHKQENLGVQFCILIQCILDCWFWIAIHTAFYRWLLNANTLIKITELSTKCITSESSCRTNGCKIKLDNSL